MNKYLSNSHLTILEYWSFIQSVKNKRRLDFIKKEYKKTYFSQLNTQYVELFARSEFIHQHLDVLHTYLNNKKQQANLDQVLVFNSIDKIVRFLFKHVDGLDRHVEDFARYEKLRRLTDIVLFYILLLYFEYYKQENLEPYYWTREIHQLLVYNRNYKDKPLFKIIERVMDQ